MLTLLLAGIIGLGALLAAVVPASPPAIPAAGASTGDATILLGDPTTLDPALQGDSGSAQITAQLFETVTTFDAGLHLQPALAERWEIVNDGRLVRFHLRPNLHFSDGSRLTAADVVRSWLRVINPRSPSPLASLLDDVDGAPAYRTGKADAATVGIRAEGDDTVAVTLSRPAADFPQIVTSPTFGVTPAGVGRDASALEPGELVASGGYVLAARTGTELTLKANEHYWAGRPPTGTIHVLTTLEGQSPVEAFEAGDVDYAAISPYDASWIAYDRGLGPSLREVPSLSLTYYGFDTHKPPFDKADVRRAFAMAVDWRRIVGLAGTEIGTVATSMVPPGIPGRSDEDFLPRFDPAAARTALAAAGYPNGDGLPKVTLVTPGTGYDDAVAAQLKENLGVTIGLESMPFDPYFARLAADPPAFWALSWVADYPGQNDFLGLLLESGTSNNYGGWSSPAFDQAITTARSSADPAAAAAYSQALGVVRDEVPAVPLAYGDGWALSRSGLLGAGQNGLGLTRMAGLAWKP